MKIKNLTMIVVSGLLISSCSDNKPEGKTGTTTTADTAKVVQKAPDERIISKNDTAKTDSLIFVVKNITEPSIDRNNSQDPSVPKEDEKFIAVQFWLKNISNKVASLNESDVVLKDQNDAEFSESTSFAEAIKPPSLFQKSDYTPAFKPNEAKSGWVIFTTSKTSKAAKIVYKNITVKL
jgi:hypothetical protein